MNTVIALFRGINVGGRNKLPMKELINILESLGHKEVRTYIQSGNVIFRSSIDIGTQVANQISQAILQEKGFEPRVLLLSTAQFQHAIEHNPFPTDSGKLLHFYFLESSPTQPNLERVLQLKSDSEEFKLVDNVFYLYAPDGIGRSKLAAGVEKALGVSATARNWNTVSKLHALIDNL